MTRWENRQAMRYYQAGALQNLFGDWEVLLVWGGIGNGYGREVYVPVDGALEAEAALERIATRRSLRGYVRVPATMGGR